MGYIVKRWDNWSSFEGTSGIEGMEAMLNAEVGNGRRLVQLVVHSEDIYLLVLEDRQERQEAQGT
ncbi:MAG: hypothetical protein ACRDZP_07260 [Acidimicrobiales bacterium]